MNKKQTLAASAIMLTVGTLGFTAGYLYPETTQSSAAFSKTSTSSESKPDTTKQSDTQKQSDTTKSASTVKLSDAEEQALKNMMYGIFDIDSIAKGDYTSITGTWNDTNGDSLVITASTIDDIEHSVGDTGLVHLTQESGTKFKSGNGWSFKFVPTQEGSGMIEVLPTDGSPVRYYNKAV